MTLRKGGVITSGELNEQANKDFNQFPSYLISSADIERLGEKWIILEKIPEHLKNGFYIANVKSSHWILLIIQYPTIFIIDPISIIKNKRDTPTNYQGLMNFAKNNKFNEIYSTEIEIQPDKSAICGAVCLYLTKKLKPMLGHITYDKLENYLDSNFYDLNKEKSKEDKLFNMKKIIDWSNKVGLY